MSTFTNPSPKPSSLAKPVAPKRGSRPRSQAQFVLGDAHDPLEREADRIAARVVANLDVTGVDATPAEARTIRRKCTACREYGEDIVRVQRKPISGGEAPNSAASSPPEFGSEFQRARAHGGRSLAPELKQRMDASFGADFSGVRVHVGEGPSALAQQIRARAFTVGGDVFFNQGQFRPHDRDGQLLLAHELTHVLQQDSGRVVRRSLDTSTTTEGTDPDRGRREYVGVEDTYDQTDCSPEQLRAILAGLERSAKAIGRASDLIVDKPDVAAPVLAYFLGPLDVEQRKVLLLTLAGVKGKLAALMPDRFVCEEGSKDAQFLPGGAEGRGSYSFQGAVAAAPAASTPGIRGSDGRLAHTLIHEAVHEYITHASINYSLQDFSAPHGVLPILPVLEGVNPLENADSITMVVVSLGLGEFPAMKSMAEKSMQAQGATEGSRKLLTAIVGYAQSVLRAVADDFTARTRTDGASLPWIGKFVQKAADAKVVRRNIDWATMARPSEPTFNDGELGRLYELMRRAYRRATEVISFDVTQIRGAEADHAGASRDKDVLRVPSALLARVQKESGLIAPPNVKLTRSTFLDIVEDLLGVMMHEDYVKTGDTTGVIANPEKFWRMLVNYWFNSDAVYQDKGDLTRSFT